MFKIHVNNQKVLRQAKMQKVNFLSIFWWLKHCSIRNIQQIGGRKKALMTELIIESENEKQNFFVSILNVINCFKLELSVSSVDPVSDL